jgi:hypothetical protein
MLNFLPVDFSYENTGFELKLFMIEGHLAEENILNYSHFRNHWSLQLLFLQKLSRHIHHPEPPRYKSLFIFQFLYE